MSYIDFFLNGSSGVVQLECIEITHPSFAKTYRYVKSDVGNVTAETKTYAGALFQIQRNNVTNDLEQTVSVTFADIDDALVKDVIKARTTGANRLKRPTFIYKIFRDDDLSTAMLTLQTLEIVDVSKDASGFVTFDAQAPELNSVKTGRPYTIEEYRLLKGI